MPGIVVSIWVPQLCSEMLESLMLNSLVLMQVVF